MEIRAERASAKVRESNRTNKRIELAKQLLRSCNLGLRIWLSWSFVLAWFWTLNWVTKFWRRPYQMFLRFFYQVFFHSLDLNCHNFFFLKLYAWKLVGSCRTWMSTCSPLLRFFCVWNRRYGRCKAINDQTTPKDRSIPPGHPQKMLHFCIFLQPYFGDTPKFNFPGLTSQMTSDIHLQHLKNAP